MRAASPTFAYTVTGITGVSSAALSDFCDALYESLRATNAIPGLGTTILRANFDCKLSESGGGRRRLQSVVSRTTILVAIVNARVELPPVAQLTAIMTSPAVVSNLAENLADTPIFASTPGSPVSMGASDTAGNFVAGPPVIVSELARMRGGLPGRCGRSAAAAAPAVAGWLRADHQRHCCCRCCCNAGDCPVTVSSTTQQAASCIDPKQLVAAFTFTSASGVGSATFTATVANQPAARCTPSPGEHNVAMLLPAHALFAHVCCCSAAALHSVCQRRAAWWLANHCGVQQ